MRHVRVDDVYRDLDWPERPDRPYLALNVVTTVDGRAAIQGRAQGIGSATDRRLMRHLRAAADALMVGAGTLRAEPVDPSVPTELADARQARGMARQPLAIVISGGADLPFGGRFFRGEASRALLLTARSASAERLAVARTVAEVHQVGESGSVDLHGALTWLRHERGVRRLLCEGGPSLNAALLRLGVVDEMFWTVAPRLAGGPPAPMVDGPPLGAEARRGLHLRSLFLHASELFLRYRADAVLGFD